MKTTLELTQITIYPIKSTCGIQLQQSAVEPIGLTNDRTLMLVDENGLFLSQRKYPQMALIKTEYISEGLLVTAPEMSPIIIDPVSINRQVCTIRVWRDSFDSFKADTYINQWFSEYLSQKVYLVRYDEKTPRAIDPQYSNKGDIVSYADGYPLLLISQASLNNLNSQLKTPVTMAHFRPNLVVTGCSAFEEDNWRRILINQQEFDLVKTCSRCIMTTVNPETGQRNNLGEPLKTLSQFRKSDGGIMFGMNLIPRNTATIKIGDSVNILGRAD